MHFIELNEHFLHSNWVHARKKRGSRQWYMHLPLRRYYFRHVFCTRTYTWNHTQLQHLPEIAFTSFFQLFDFNCTRFWVSIISECSFLHINEFLINILLCRTLFMLYRSETLTKTSPVSPLCLPWPYFSSLPWFFITFDPFCERQSLATSWFTFDLSGFFAIA